MKLYLLTRTDKWSYDDYDSFVVAAENQTTSKNGGCSEWTSKENIKIEHIGESNSLIEKLIISSFNAG